MLIVVGVPLRTPAELMLIPGGNAPETTLKSYCRGHPLNSAFRVGNSNNAVEERWVADDQRRADADGKRLAGRGRRRRRIGHLHGETKTPGSGWRSRK